MRRNRSVIFSLAILGLCGSIAGCAGKKAKVAGTVVLDNQPLAEVMVQFTPSGNQGGTANSMTALQGNFTLYAQPGDYKITFYKPSAGLQQPPSGNDPEIMNKLQKGMGPTKHKKVKSIIPVKYRDESKTDLVCTVPTNENLKLVLERDD